MNLFDRIIKKIKNRYLRHLMYSAAAILICLIFVNITGWALFSSTVSTGKSVLEAAVYGIEVEISDENGNTVKSDGLVTEDGYTFTLSPGKYNITLAADGTVSEKLSGYGKVVIGSDSPRYTKPMYRGDRISFTLLSDQQTDISFSFGWGSLAGDGDIVDGTVIDKTEKPRPAPTTTTPTTVTTQTTAETSTTATEPTTTQTTPTTTENHATTEPNRSAETLNRNTSTATTSTRVETTGYTTTTNTDIE